MLFALGFISATIICLVLLVIELVLFETTASSIVGEVKKQVKDVLPSETGFVGTPDDSEEIENLILGDNYDQTDQQDAVS